MPITNQYNSDIVPSPGDTLLETIKCRSLSQAELAKRLGISAKAVSDIINAKQAITHDVAYKLEKAIGIPSAFWINREKRYQEYLIQKKKIGSLKNIHKVSSSSKK